MWYQFKKKERKRRETVNCGRGIIGKCFIGIFGIHASVLWCESTRLKISMYKTASRFSKLLACKLFWSKDKQNVAFCNLADSCGLVARCPLNPSFLRCWKKEEGHYKNVHIWNHIQNLGTHGQQEFLLRDDPPSDLSMKYDEIWKYLDNRTPTRAEIKWLPKRPSFNRGQFLNYTYPANCDKQMRHVASSARQWQQSWSLRSWQISKWR